MYSLLISVHSTYWLSMMLSSLFHLFSLVTASSVPLRTLHSLRAPAAPMMAAPPGEARESDGAEYEADPAAYCRSRLAAHGSVFVSGAFGGCVVVGADDLFETVRRAGYVIEESGALPAPFAPAAEDDGSLYEAHAAAINAACYEALFKSIPLFKEQGGFGTFKFEDFIIEEFTDARVRPVAPAARRLVFAALAPVLLGVPPSELPEHEELKTSLDWQKAYAAYGATLRGGGGRRDLPFGLGGLIGGAANAANAALAESRAAPLREALHHLRSTRGGDGASGVAFLASGDFSGGEALARVAAAVEPTASLLSSMLAQTQREPALGAALEEEQKAAMAGSKPDAPVDAPMLAAMPTHRALALEALRLYPPARPSRVRLAQSILIEGGADPRAYGVELPAGTLVVPEPHVGHFFGRERAGAFDVSRHVGASAEPPPALGLPGELRRWGGARDALVLNVAIACFVQLRRMFELKLGNEPPAGVGGWPVRSIADDYKMLAEPRMYYEIKRGVRKLKF